MYHETACASQWRRKLRSVFWRAWTLRHIDGGGSSAAPFGETSLLGLQSHRDRFILRRARAVMAQAFPEPSSAAPFGPEDFMSEEQMLQAAIEASLISTPSETRGEADRTSTSRSLEEAGIKTPDSSLGVTGRSAAVGGDDRAVTRARRPFGPLVPHVTSDVKARTPCMSVSVGPNRPVLFD